MQTEPGLRRRCIGRLILALLVIFSSVLLTKSICAAQTAASADVLTLKKAVEIALKNHPTIQAQAGQVASGEAKLGQARGNYYPHVSLAGAYTTIWPVSQQTALTTSNSGLPPGNFVPTGTRGAFEQYATVGSISQLLFDFGKTWAQVSAQKLSTEAARHDLASIREQVILDVKQAYYNLLGIQRAQGVAAESVQQFKKQLDRARALYTVGAKSRLDVTKAEVDLSNAEVNLIKVEYGARVARATLSNAIGLPEVFSYAVEDDLASPSTEESFEEALRIAFARRPDLLSLQEKKESARESIKAAQRAHFPTLNGSANLTYVGDSFPLDHGWTAGLFMSVPIFTGFITTYQVAEAQAALSVASANERGLRQAIVLDLEQGFLALNEATKRSLSTEVALKQARENMELATERYAAGLVIAIEVTDALVAHANAELAHIGALYDRKVAQARIDKGVGDGRSNR
jgi:outer membrane protein